MGKAYRLPSASDRLRKHQIEIKDLQATNRNRNTPRPVASTAFSGVSAAGETGGGTGNFLQTAGGTMIGPIAFNPPVDFTIDIDGSNTIDIGQSSSNSQYSSNVQLEDVPTSTTLDIIAGAGFDGQILILRTFAPNPITISQATLGNGGNIQTGDGNDIVLGDLQIVGLIFDDKLIIEANTGGSWRVMYVTSGSGTSGVSFPITPPVSVRGNVAIDQDIDLSATVAHSTTMTLTGSIDITFSNIPASGTQIEYEVEITQDGTGGHLINNWPASVTPVPVIDTTAGATTIVVLRVNDGGTIVRTVLATAGTTGVTALSGLTIDVNKDWLAQGISNFGALTGVTGIDLDGATALIQGVKELRFFDDDPNKNIQSATDEISYNTPALDQHSFYAGGVEIARFVEAAASVYRLDMLAHSIHNAKDVLIDDSAGVVTFAGTAPALGFDSVASRLILNMPAGDNLFVTNNNVIGSTQMNNNSFTSNIVNASDVLQLGVDVTVPSVVGEFRSDGTDVKVFSGGVVRNLSNVGVQNSISQLDSNVTVTDVGSGVVVTTVDGTNRFQVQAGRVDLADIPIFGVTTLNFSEDQNIASTTSGIVWNFPDNTDDFELRFNSVSAININLLRTQLLSNTPNTTGAALSLFRDDPSPTANDELSTITFDGRDSATNFTTYSQIVGEIISPTSTTEIGRLRWSVLDSGILVNSLTLSPGNMTLKEFSSVAGDKAEFHLTKEDATPSTDDNIGAISFDLFDSPTTTTYTQIQGIVGDATDFGILEFNVRADNTSLTTGLQLTGDDNVTDRSYLTVNARIDSDLAFGFDGGGSLDAKISPVSASTTLGIVVQDNVSFTVGDEGTNAVPLDPGTITSNIAGLDAAFGDHVGSQGFIEVASTLTLFVKQNNGNWGSVAYTFDSVTS